MATACRGQMALMELPAPLAKEKNATRPKLGSYTLPPSLQEERKSLKSAGSSGMAVYKVSKVRTAQDPATRWTRSFF